MNNPMDDLKKAIDKFSKDLYDTTNIYLANPKTLLHMDMSEIPSNVWFISQEYVKEGEIALVNDANLKRELYKFCEDHQDRIFKGNKSFLN